MGDSRRVSGGSVIDDVTCMGCGCLCDDIEVTVDANRIVATRNACALGAAWFGDGIVPRRALVDGRDTPLEATLATAAERLKTARRVLVYLAPNLSCEAQRVGTTIADLLGGVLDTVTTATTRHHVLASQERGLASATLGEIRNRADLVVFWAVDVDRRYPRFASRYAPGPRGTHVPNGRSSRAVIAVDVGEATGPADADHRVTIDPADEVAALSALQALARAPVVDHAPPGEPEGAAWTNARALAPHLFGARYGALVYDGEPDERAARSPGRFDALVALAHSLNDATRFAAIALRGGGNRSGADAILTAQTGFPMAVDFARGYPRYRPHDGSALTRLDQQAFDLVLILGEAALLPPDVSATLSRVGCVIVGPRASDVALGASSVAVDAGVPGIHSPGLALRMDEVPLPLRALLQGPPPIELLLAQLARAVRGAA